jgi:predicted Zn-dependent peptidase
VLQTSVDGIPVFHAPGPAPVAAGLVFGVGRADETFVRGGLTHLVEHLAMYAAGRWAIDVNASVDLTTTEFTATGPPAQVAAFLRAVCLALTDLPTDRLAVETDVLRTEGAAVAGPTVGALLTERYGIAGPGLAAAREPALRSLIAEEVRDWARTWFSRRNAALWLVGPEIPDLTLPLTDGPAPSHAPVSRVPIRTPAWAPLSQEDRVAIGADLPDDPALGSTLGILRVRIEDELRHRRGIAYAVEADRIVVDSGNRFVVLTTDVRPGQVDVAAPLMWRQVQHLARQGPRPEELQFERAVMETYLDDPRAALDEVRAHAHGHVTGGAARTSDQMRADAASLTADDVRRVAGALASSALVAVPEPLESLSQELARLPEWSTAVVSGRQFERKRLSGVPKGARLVVGAEGMSVALTDDERITVRWAEAVGLIRTGPGEWLLFGRDGFSIPISVGDWRDGEEAMELVRAAVPSQLQVVDDDAEDAGGLLVFRAPAHQVGEAVALSRHGAVVASNAEWTAVVMDGDRSAQECADELADVVGRNAVGLILRRTHADLEYVLLRGRRETDRHRWGVAPGKPELLAQATWRTEAQVAPLLGATGDPEEILDRFVTVLGLPSEVPELLAGRVVPGLQRFEGLGIAGGFRASVRGDFVPPAGSGSALDAYRRLSAARPLWYRAVNALGALVAGALLWLMITFVGVRAGNIVPTVMCALGLLTCLWDTRPPRRRTRVHEESSSELTPSG